MKIFGFRGACAMATLALGLLATSPAAQAGRYADIIVDVQSGRILRSQDADSLRYPASLTKMMTLYLTFDELKAGRLRLDKPLVASDFAAAQSPTSMGLQPGDVISVEEAIYALAVKSANDASVVLAEALAGSEPAFAERMTRRAREMHTMVQQAATRHGVVYVRLFEEREQDPFVRNPALNASDGLHPSDAGYAAWFDALRSQAPVLMRRLELAEGR